MRTALPLLLTVLLLAGACNRPDGESGARPEAPPEALLAALDSAAVRARIEHLSSDAMQGRAPGTPGESLAVAYIAEQMRAAGLEPAGPDGSYFQKVPLLGATPRPGPLTFVHQNETGETARYRFVDDFTISTDFDTTRTSVAGQLVFVGYGVDAPAYEWDDYKGADVEGKILVMFVNDPPATEAEPNLFQADTLTYFGRWTYKYEEARRKGALGVLLIHTDETAGYPFTVLSGHAASEQVQLADPPANPLAAKGWVTRQVGEQLAQMAGTTLDAWYEAAASREFRPQPLAVEAQIDVDYAVRRLTGTNVLGKITGRVRPDEAILYTAHHDHLGIGRPVAGDSIYNGAVDNATGVAMLLTLGEAFARQDPAPERTVLFASVTAEEAGLLGAEYYARNPVLPMAQTVANINVDSGNIGGETDDIVGIGAERSEMGGLLADAAGAEGMTVTADPRPGQGIFFRSDQLAFARAGVPAVFINTGRSFRGRSADHFERVVVPYNAERYHKPSDEFDPAWPMGGIVQQLRVAFRIGYRLANSDLTPQWNAGEGFAAARESGAAGS